MESQGKMTCKQAMILAAGRGSRFRPLTDERPKPLIDVGGEPLIDWQLRQLLLNGIEKVVINCCYKADMLMEHIRQRDYGLEVIFSVEDTALETGGGIKRALPHFNGELFYAINSDVILHPLRRDVITQLARVFSVKPETKLALLLHVTSGALGIHGAGDFFCNEHGVIWRRGNFDTAPYYFTGVQLMHPDIFTDIDSTIFSMNLVYDKLLHDEPEAIRGMINKHMMLHIGDPDAHAVTTQYLNDYRDGVTEKTAQKIAL